ncbi:MAG: aldo/keto reductase [Ignavibacterium sp.]
MMASKIALGTVQFGLNYGINNRTGIPTDDDISKLLVFANKSGIETLDTAHNYGESERRLGRLIDENNLKFNLISKAPKEANSKNIFRYFDESLKRLKKKYIYGYLLHDFNDYINDKTILISLSTLKEKGKVGKIGFSLYYPEQLEKLLNDNIKFDLLQLPYNLADRRFETYFSELKEREIEIHIRSVFLQGLFFMESNDLKIKLKPFSKFISKLKEIKNSLNRSTENIALNFALQNEKIDKVIIGLDTTEQLIRNINSCENLLTQDELNFIKNEIQKIELPKELLIPSNWN